MQSNYPYVSLIPSAKRIYTHLLIQGMHLPIFNKLLNFIGCIWYCKGNYWSIAKVWAYNINVITIFRMLIPNVTSTEKKVSSLKDKEFADLIALQSNN